MIRYYSETRCSACPSRNVEADYTHRDGNFILTLRCGACGTSHAVTDADRAALRMEADVFSHLAQAPIPGSLAHLQEMLGSDGEVMGLGDPAALHETIAQAVGEDR